MGSHRGDPRGQGYWASCTAELMFLGLQVCTAPASEACSPESSFLARLVRGPHFPRSLCTSQGCLKGGACDLPPPPPHLYIALYFPKSLHIHYFFRS